MKVLWQLFIKDLENDLRITPYYDVTGAFGAALAAMESLTEKESDDQIQINTELYDRNREWFLAGYDGKMEPGLPVVGIPQCMMLYKFFPMAYQYFKNLGFNVLLSRQSDEEMVHLSQELVQEETCYPVKLLHGHMESLARQKVDYMFIPCIRTLRHATSGVKHNYGCVICSQHLFLLQKHWDWRKEELNYWLRFLIWIWDSLSLEKLCSRWE